MIKEYKQFGDLHNPEYEDTDRIYQALENLIKGYRELEEMLKHRIKYTNELEKDLFENASNYVIPKSKIKEKIEEFKNSILENLDEDRRWCDIELVNNFERLLQELMEDK